MALLAFAGMLHMAPASSAAEGALYGAYGPEGPRLREQFWILPSADPSVVLRATVFRPASDGAADPPRPMVVINHGTSDLTRESVSMPVYYWLSRWFVERGYVVVLPQRRGHGATGGPLVESVGNCADPDHFRSGLVAAGDIAAVIGFMGRQPFVDPDKTVVVGISTGGWASLALASHQPALASAVINFAGGRGGHAAGQKNAVCSAARLVEASRRYAGTSRIPTLWLYSENDSYFGPELASRMAAAWRSAGGLVQLERLPPYGEDGHNIADDRAGWDIWGPAIDRFLDAHLGRPPADHADPPAQSIASDASAAPLVPVGGDVPSLDH